MCTETEKISKVYTGEEIIKTFINVKEKTNINQFNFE